MAHQQGLPVVAKAQEPGKLGSGGVLPVSWIGDLCVAPSERWLNVLYLRQMGAAGTQIEVIERNRVGILIASCCLGVAAQERHPVGSEPC